MKVYFDYLDQFERRAKTLRKKYASFDDDYEAFINELENNPFGGESLGKHTYKTVWLLPLKEKAIAAALAS